MADILGKVKKWYGSLTAKSSMGLLAMGLGLIGITISTTDLSFLFSAIPAFVTAALAFATRLASFTKGLGVGGWLTLIVGLVGGSANVLPMDLMAEWDIVQNYWVGITQIMLTLLASYGIHRKDTKLVFDND